jgi:predicted Na+-dependent transporter
MRSVLRSILAVAAGFVAATVIMMAAESLNGRVLYPELGRLAQGMTDREAIRALMASAPTGALLVVLLGWLIGGLAAGWIAAWVGRRRPIAHAAAVGALLTLAGIANNLMIPPPAWFWIAGLVVFLPAALFGAQFAPPTTLDRRRAVGNG